MKFAISFHSELKIVTLIMGICYCYCASEEFSRDDDENPSIFIESKLNGNVLTVIEEHVPPEGLYQRRGVVPLERNSSISRSWQMLYFTQEQSLGSIMPLNASALNLLTAGLESKEKYAYPRQFNVSQVTVDGGRQLRTVTDDPNTCVRNQGEGEFITFVECDENDFNQIWFFRGVE